MKPYRRVLCLFTAMIFLGMKAHSSDMSDLKILNAVKNSKPLSLEVCKSRKNCEKLDISHQSLSSEIELVEHRYQIDVKVEEKFLDQFQYTLGPKKHYTLLLFGIAEKKVKRSLKSKITDRLSGYENVSTLGFQLDHKMVDLAPGQPWEPGKIRVANLVPGKSPVEVELIGQKSRLKFPPTTYGNVSGIKQFAPDSVEIVARLPNAQTEFARIPLTIRHGDDILIAVTKRQGSQFTLIIDKRSI